jgi:hypothetical protein
MLSILIVNWNTRELLRACLESLRTSCAGLEHEVIVVDNASSDGSAAMVREGFPGVHLIASETNLGFAAGNNRAYEVSAGEWVWLLNPDTEVLGDAPRRMVEFLERHAKAGAVASALIDARDGHIQRSCRTFPTPAALWAESTGLASRYPNSKRLGFYRMGWWNYSDTRRVEQPMASSLLLRRAAVEAAGGLFDEQFPIFFNDVDLCLRLIRAKWDIWFLPTARVRHWGGAATGQIKPEMIRESHRCLRLFYEKHYRGRILAPLYAATVAMFEAAGLARYFLTRRKAARASA